MLHIYKVLYSIYYLFILKTVNFLIKIFLFSYLFSLTFLPRCIDIVFRLWSFVQFLSVKYYSFPRLILFPFEYHLDVPNSLYFRFRFFFFFLVICIFLSNNFYNDIILWSYIVKVLTLLRHLYLHISDTLHFWSQLFDWNYPYTYLSITENCLFLELFKIFHP